MSYDGLGRLVQIIDKRSGTIVGNHSFFWCGNQRCAEHDVTQRLASNNNVPAIQRMYFQQGTVDGGFPFRGVPSYYVRDALGSVRELIDDTAPNPVVLAGYEYDPYGNQTRVAGVAINGTQVDSDIGFAGYFVHQATGLDFAVNRAYYSRLGRWLTRDPIGWESGVGDPIHFNADSLNLYSYARGNPVSLVDPSGNDPAGLAAGAAAGGSFVGWIGWGIGAAGGAVIGIPTGAGELVTIPVGAIGGASLGFGVGSFVGGVLGDALGDLVNLAVQDNEYSKEAKINAKSTGDPLAELAKIEAALKAAGKWTAEVARKIVQAEKFLGGRNKQKRQDCK